MFKFKITFFSLCLLSLPFLFHQSAFNVPSEKGYIELERLANQVLKRDAIPRPESPYFLP